MSFSTQWTQSISRVLILVTTLLCAAIGSGCGRDSKGPSVEPSGFLGDYSQLALGREGQTRLIFIDPEADFSIYDKMMIEPVSLWDSERSRPIAMPTPDQRRLAERAQRTLSMQFGRDFQLIDEAQPGTLSLRMAITRAEGTRVGAELEIVDVTSGTRLIGIVDDRDFASSVDADAADPLGEAIDHWLSLIRMCLVACRNFDAAQKVPDRAPGV